MNEPYKSTTDLKARLYRMGLGMEAKLWFTGYTLMEKRSGLIVDTRLTSANGHAERIVALSMIEPRADWPKAISVGADKTYDAEDFGNELRLMNVRVRAAWSTNRHRPSGRTTWHLGYGRSQRIRKSIEEGFGWIKTVSGCARPASMTATS